MRENRRPLTDWPNASGFSSSKLWECLLCRRWVVDWRKEWSRGCMQLVRFRLHEEYWKVRSPCQLSLATTTAVPLRQHRHRITAPIVMYVEVMSQKEKLYNVSLQYSGCVGSSKFGWYAWYTQKQPALNQRASERCFEMAFVQLVLTWHEPTEKEAVYQRLNGPHEGTVVGFLRIGISDALNPALQRQ